VGTRYGARGVASANNDRDYGQLDGERDGGDVLFYGRGAVIYGGVLNDGEGGKAYLGVEAPVTLVAYEGEGEAAGFLMCRGGREPIQGFLHSAALRSK